MISQQGQWLVYHLQSLDDQGGPMCMYNVTVNFTCDHSNYQTRFLEDFSRKEEEEEDFMTNLRSDLSQNKNKEAIANRVRDLMTSNNIYLRLNTSLTNVRLHFSHKNSRLQLSQ